MRLSRTDFRGKWIAGLLSGGLDSTTIVHWLSQVGARVLSITVNLGQPDETDIGDIPKRMKAAGAEEAVMVDGRSLLARYMLQVIQGQAFHEGGYWNTTGIARMATVVAALRPITERGITFLTHGATGRGNDQVRFEIAPAMLAPQIQVYAPWRDPEFLRELGGRKEMLTYCAAHNLNVRATTKKPYSTDANFCGLTHEAGELEFLTTPTSLVEFIMGVAPDKAPETAEDVEIRFKCGRPVAVNGKTYNKLPSVFSVLNHIAGRNGVGIGLDVVENRRVGIKSRGVYEAPGVTLLASAYTKLLQTILDRNRRKFFDIVSRQLADVVYEGEWFGPLAGDLLAVVNRVASHVSGTVSFSLYKGNIRFLQSSGEETCLYCPERSSMESIGEFDHTDSQGYLNVHTVLARALAYAKQTRTP